MTTLGAQKNGCLKEGNCYDLTARLVCTINNWTFVHVQAMVFLQSYVIMLVGCLPQTENKRICQISGLKSPCGRLRNFSRGGLQESFWNSIWLKSKMIIYKVVVYGRWSLIRSDADCVCESWILTSPQVIMTWAILEMRSAACCLTLADLLFNLQRMVPQICGKYGFTRLPSAFTTVPKPFSITISWE